MDAKYFVLVEEDAASFGMLPIHCKLFDNENKAKDYCKRIALAEAKKQKESYYWAKEMSDSEFEEWKREIVEVIDKHGMTTSDEFDNITFGVFSNRDPKNEFGYEASDTVRYIRWSVEDDCWVDNIINDETCPLDHETIGWVRSLKDRISHE